MRASKPKLEGFLIDITSPPIRDRLEECRLYLVTDSRPRLGDFDRFLAEVLAAGVGMVQLREKTMEAAPLMKQAEIVRRRTAETGALFIVNDRVDVALAVGADGVHLGQDDLPIEEARRQLGPELLIGVSTHSEAQLDRAMSCAADYCAVGPVFATPTKPGRAAVGLSLVRYASLKRDRPVFAIGGIGLDSVARVVAAGAQRISVVRALTQAEQPGMVASNLLAAINRA